MTHTRITKLDPLPPEESPADRGPVSNIPNTERPCTAWAWEQIRQGKGGNYRGKYVLLAAAEHADRALWSSNGYSRSTLEDLVHLSTLETRKVEASIQFLVSQGLLVEHSRGGWRIAEEAFSK